MVTNCFGLWGNMANGSVKKSKVFFVYSGCRVHKINSCLEMRQEENDAHFGLQPKLLSRLLSLIMSLKSFLHVVWEISTNAACVAKIRFVKYLEAIHKCI